MENYHGPYLTSAEPVVGYIVRIDRLQSGYELWMRHRHYSGYFEQCPAFEVGQLGLEELLDCLEVVIAGGDRSQALCDYPF